MKSEPPYFVAGRTKGHTYVDFRLDNGNLVFLSHKNSFSLEKIIHYDSNGSLAAILESQNHAWHYAGLPSQRTFWKLVKPALSAGTSELINRHPFRSSHHAATYANLFSSDTPKLPRFYLRFGKVNQFSLSSDDTPQTYTDLVGEVIDLSDLAAASFHHHKQNYTIQVAFQNSKSVVITYRPLSQAAVTIRKLDFSGSHTLRDVNLRETKRYKYDITDPAAQQQVARFFNALYEYGSLFDPDSERHSRIFQVTQAARIPRAVVEHTKLRLLRR